jgi:DNA polymerase V
MSRELKELGIVRGAPYFKVRGQLEQLGAAVFSSNYALYQDISDRVMAVISSFGYPCEVYSIDEAFIFLDGEPTSFEQIGQMIAREVLRTTGIPVSVGFGRTKTLAKAANRHAKRYGGVFCISPSAEDSLLAETVVTDLWGIGVSKGRFLLTHGITSALQLRDCADNWVQRHLSLTTLKSVWELRGIPSIVQEGEVPDKQGILTSLGFGSETGELSDLEDALTVYAATAVRKLQQQGSQADRLMVFLQTSRFAQRRYANSMEIRLHRATSYLPDILTPALKGLRTLFIEGFLYAKTGIYLSGIDAEDHLQGELFDQSHQKKLKAARSIYEIQSRYGKQSISCRSASPTGSWNMKRRRLSNCYTTRWEELPRVV